MPIDHTTNPFAPGAGTLPPELAGREDIISETTKSLQRVTLGLPTQSLILYGLRGTGKTVLLNRIWQITDSEPRAITKTPLEAPEGGALAELLYPQMHGVLRKLSMVEQAKESWLAAIRALKSFASALKISVGNIELSVHPEPGVADSGNIEYDLPELFMKIGLAAKAAGRAWVLLIDELQYLRKNELSALIVAIHKTNQQGLPVWFVGAGLPQLTTIMGDTKSYAERLFEFRRIDALERDAAIQAIQQPIERAGEKISVAALDKIVAETKGYPYFLQVWGSQTWNIATSSPITETNVTSASDNALQDLDQGFFRARYGNLTGKEQEYVIAMASLGPGPHRSSDVADKLGKKPTELTTRRSSIIDKGVIYSPKYGTVAFTVPMFDGFIERLHAPNTSQ